MVGRLAAPAACTEEHWALTARPVGDAHLGWCMRTEQSPRSGLDPLLSVAELAEYLGVPARTVYDWRQTGHGPTGIRIGRHLKYAVSDVTAWIDAQRQATVRRESEAR